MCVCMDTHTHIHMCVTYVCYIFLTDVHSSNNYVHIYLTTTVIILTFSRHTDTHYIYNISFIAYNCLIKYMK